MRNPHPIMYTTASSATDLGAYVGNIREGYLRAIARAAVTCDYIVEAI